MSASVYTVSVGRQKDVTRTRITLLVEAWQTLALESFAHKCRSAGVPVRPSSSELTRAILDVALPLLEKLPAAELKAYLETDAESSGREERVRKWIAERLAAKLS